MANLNAKVPSVRVRVANGLPERSVASATLASVPSLPPAAIQGHVMPSFPHTLIGLGPFADLGCQIVFTKTAVSVIHPDGHSILEGWQEPDGPRLWRFPLKANKPSLPVTVTKKYEELGPRGSAAKDANQIIQNPNIFPKCSSFPQVNASPSCTTPINHGGDAKQIIQNPNIFPKRSSFPQVDPKQNIQNQNILPKPPPSSPIQCPAALPLSRPLTADPVTLIHPSQGCLAIDNTGQACLVTYMYGVAQAMALAAQSSKTPFDPRGPNLPSMGALVGFYHACLGFPVKQT